MDWIVEHKFEFFMLHEGQLNESMVPDTMESVLGA